VQHLIILGLIGTLSTGLAAVALLPRPSGVFARALAWMRVPLILYNAWSGAVAAFVYLTTYVADQTPDGAVGLFESAGTLLIGLCGPCWLHAHIVLVDRLQEAPNRRAPVVLRAAPVIVGAAVVAGWAFAARTGSRETLVSAAGWTRLLNSCAALGASAWLMGIAWRPARSPWRTAVLRLSAWYTALGAATVMIRFAARFVSVPGTSVYVAGLVLNLVYNAIPVAWSRRLDKEGRIELGRSDAATPQANLEPVFARYGITTREREVIEMIRQGLTNQEIADRLFIAVRTVKDHNSAIFRKTGVRNRTELSRLFAAPVR
jgi:DNA-binding CsgD family transcriptional regulator